MRMTLLRVDAGALVVEVRDDGIGAADPIAGSGLRGLRDRVEAVGGTLEVSSPVGAGTTIRAKLEIGAPSEWPGVATSLGMVR